MQTRAFADYDGAAFLDFDCLGKTLQGGKQQAAEKPERDCPWRHMRLIRGYRLGVPGLQNRRIEFLQYRYSFSAKAAGDATSTEKFRRAIQSVSVDSSDQRRRGPA